MTTKDDIIYYVKKELESIGMFLMLHDEKEGTGQFIWNKFDRKRAHIRLNPSFYTTEDFVMVALHELGHARMYRKYSSREFMNGTLAWHELGAWNIAFREAESLGLKFDKEFVQRCLFSHETGILEVEGLMNKWKHCLYSPSYA